MNSRMRFLLSTALIFTAWIVRLLITLNGEPLCYDETFSVVIAGLPLDRTLAATAGDVHPPLYYVLLHVWMAGNPTSFERYARGMSFVLMLFGTLVLYDRLLYRLDLSKTEHSIAYILSMWLPGLTYFSSEARMYALLCVLILGALLCLWRASYTTCRGEILWNGAAGVLIGLACLTHNVGLIYAPVLAVSAVVYRRRRGVPLRLIVHGLLLCSGVAMIIYAPWLGTLLHQMQFTSQGYWIQPPSVGTVAYHLYMAMCYGIIASRPATAFMLIIAAITTTGMVLMVVKRDHEAIIMIAGVLLLMAIVSHITGTGVMLHRTMLPLDFLLLIGWAHVISRQWIAVIPIILVCAFSSSMMLADGRMRVDYSLWHDLQTEPGDIIYANNSAAVPLLLYTDLPIIVAWQDVPMATGLSRETLEAIGIPMLRLESVKWQRAWFMWFEVPYTTDSERAYKSKIISEYEGDLIWRNYNDPFSMGELWRLQSGNPITN